MTDVTQDETWQKYSSSSGTNNINGVSPITLCTDAYSGFGGFRNGSYLVSHPREDEFNARVGYSYYINIFRPIVDSIVNPVFKRDPGRETNSKIYEAFLENCDRNGNSFTKFMKRMAVKAKTVGTVFMVMDNYAEQPKNIKEVEENRIFPYVYMKEVKDVVAWEITKFGEIISIAFSEDSQNSKSGKKNEKQYRQWTKDGWKVFEEVDKGVLSKPTGEEGILDFGMLPVIPLYSEDPESNCLISEPPFYPIAQISAGIYNLTSELRGVMRSQGFNILTLPTMGGNQPKDVEIGKDNMLGFPHDSKHKPSVLTFDSSVMDIFVSERDILFKKAYEIAKLAGVSGQVDTKTGIAKAWDFQATDTVLSNLARELEDHEKLTAILFGRWIKQDIEIKVSYPEDFGVVDIDTNITKHERLTEQGMPVEVIKTSKKQLVMDFFSDLEPDEVKALVESVEKQSDDEIQSKQNEKLDDKINIGGNDE